MHQAFRTHTAGLQSPVLWPVTTPSLTYVLCLDVQCSCCHLSVIPCRTWTSFLTWNRTLSDLQAAWFSLSSSTILFGVIALCEVSSGLEKSRDVEKKRWWSLLQSKTFVNEFDTVFAHQMMGLWLIVHAYWILVFFYFFIISLLRELTIPYTIFFTF